MTAEIKGTHIAEIAGRAELRLMCRELIEFYDKSGWDWLLPLEFQFWKLRPRKKPVGKWERS